MTGMAKNMGRQKWIKESPACTYQKKLLEEISEERNRGVRTSWSASPHNIYNNRKKSRVRWKCKGEKPVKQKLGFSLAYTFVPAILFHIWHSPTAVVLCSSF